MNYCFRFVLLIDVVCLRMFDLSYFYFICFAFKSKVHGVSALEPGTSVLVFYCTPPLCVPDVIGGLVVRQHNSNNEKKTNRLGLPSTRYRVIPAHRNHDFDPASGVLLNSH